jgi:hypothetical protein
MYVWDASRPEGGIAAEDGARITFCVDHFTSNRPFVQDLDGDGAEDLIVQTSDHEWTITQEGSWHLWVIPGPIADGVYSPSTMAASHIYNPGTSGNSRVQRMPDIDGDGLDDVMLPTAGLSSHDMFANGAVLFQSSRTFL